MVRSAHLLLFVGGLLQLGAAYALHRTQIPDWTDAEITDSFRSQAVARHGQLAVRGGRLVDAAGEPVSLRGVSLHGQQWYPAAPGWTVPSIVRMFHADMVRVPVYVEAANPEAPQEEWGGYSSAPQQAMTRTRAVIEDALDAGVYVVVDWHITGNPDAFRAQALEFFDQIAADYGHHPNLIYEIANEPAGVGWPLVKDYAQAVIPAIRAHDPDNLIVVGTPTWSQDVHVAAADPLEDEGVLYALHYYAGTQPLEEIAGKAERALQAGAALMVTEWGPSDVDGTTVDFEVGERWVDYMERRGLSWAGWSLGNRDDRSSLLGPGAPLSGPWGADDLTETGAWMLPHLLDPPGRDAWEVLALLEQGRAGDDGVIAVAVEGGVDLEPHLALGGLSFSARGGREVSVSLVDADGAETRLRLEDFQPATEGWVRYELPLSSFPFSPGEGAAALDWGRLQRVRFSSSPVEGGRPLEVSQVTLIEDVAPRWRAPGLRWEVFDDRAPDVTLHTAEGEGGALSIDFEQRDWAPLALSYEPGDERRGWSAHYGLALDLGEGGSGAFELHLIDASGERWVAAFDAAQGTALLPFRGFVPHPDGHPEGAVENGRLDLEEVSALHLSPASSSAPRLEVAAIRLSNERAAARAGAPRTARAVLRGALDAPVGRVSPGLLGINAATWDGDLLSPETVERVAAVGHPVVRFPGADGYRWEQARASGDGQVHTDAFLDWLEQVGAEGLFTVDCAAVTPEEAARWVERAGGRVPYWEISAGGLHSLVSPAPMSAADYGLRARALIQAMRGVEPGIRVGVVQRGRDPAWNRAVLEVVGGLIDAVVVQQSAQAPGLEDDGLLLSTPGHLARRAGALRDAASAQLGRELSLWVTSWTSVSGTPGPQTLSAAQGVWAASYLAALAGEGAELAGYWAVHNGPTPEGGDFGYLSRSYDPLGGDRPRPTYHALRMAADALRGQRYPVEADAPALRATLTRDDRGRAALLVINVDPDITWELSLEISGMEGPLTVELLDGDAPRAGSGEAVVVPPRALALVRQEAP